MMEPMGTMKAKAILRTIYKKIEHFGICRYANDPDMSSSSMQKYYTYKHFLSLPPASIDYSPYQPAPLVVMLLEESELREAKEYQFERFWRVWYTERNTYAPKLQTLVLGLRVNTDKEEGSSASKGIKEFLEYFDTYVYPMGLQEETQKNLQIYIINDEAELASAFRILP